MVGVLIKEPLVVMWGEWIGSVGWFGSQDKTLQASNLSVSKSLLNRSDGHRTERKVQMQD